MAGSVNKVIILGNLGANPELKYLPSGQPVCEMRVATSEVFKDKNDQRQERTEWHKVVVWGKTGENCAKFLSKGRQVYLEGRLQTRSWDDKDGNKRYMTEIVADQVVFLRDGAGAGAGMQAGPAEDGMGAPRSAGSYGGGGGGGRSYDSGRGRPGAPAGRGAPDEVPPQEDFGTAGGDDDIPF